MTAETTSVDVVEAAGNTAHIDMSMIGMFMNADLVVQAVMIMLLLTSVWSWAVMFEKFAAFKAAFFNATRFQDKFWASDDLDECYENMRRGRGHPLQRVFVAGMQEWYSSNIKGLGTLDQAHRDSILERLDKIMMVARNKELDKLENHLGHLATIGATAPFVGLFGTVWGIMNSFQSIAVQKNTSLVVVAPGIAEALLATAIGLFAAIPAVIAYNRYSAHVSRMGGIMEDFSTEYSALLSRQLDSKRED